VCPASPIRPQTGKERNEAVFFAHLYGRKWGKGGMRPCAPPPRYGRNLKKTELRPCELLIYTAAKREKDECGRTTFLAYTAAIGERQNCGRAFRSSLRPQIEKRRNAAVLPSSPIRPQMEKGEPNDSTNFGSHANPGIGSHFGQTKFLAIHSASPKIKRMRSGLVVHLYGRK